MYQKNLLEKLRRIDLFPKYIESASVKTKSGAFLSIASYLLLAFLFLNEFRLFIANDYETKLTIDDSTGPTSVEIYFNITFPNLKCGFLHVDTLDKSGERHLNVKHRVYYMPLDEVGNALDKRNPQILGHLGGKERYCGSCYGAEQYSHNGCCDTCEEIRDAYYKAGWDFVESNFEQCGHPKKKENNVGHGCLLYGTLRVNKVDGTFHIAPGVNVVRMRQHLHSIDKTEFENGNIDCSHTINQLTFGKPLQGTKNPLAGIDNFNHNKEMMYQYFLKVVPTYYRKTEKFQYSAYKFSRELNRLQSRGYPGVFFKYEFAPIVIQIEKQKKSFFHFITQSLSLLGGVFTFSFLIDRLIFTLLINKEKKSK
ncbi:endoplasmic reticulum-golgi intermediate compartment protein [Anaeramoeba flamelloides]|uniref:Endoplasmic reticulum-golgi intermediate compartment protein n=1 Tax=Anaeramoeba flamelloides TaxID=1746091 RepID=A0AAV7YW71_9EUKA|nr:endoplasmic reticulum-golgi intermediate compartment protein [Anaeramoeba flamelloides]KAJ6246669.1 endoplasmic reticulum-golgi intermediate compartment protein [Anaeramoeba flamelloides]